MTEHLYVHLPFCVHRCGYCDFVTAVGRPGDHGSYVDALVRELELERRHLADPVTTVFVGGGTPTFTEPAALRTLLAALPKAVELTVEANPETVTTGLAVLLRDAGVSRVSLGAQSFQAHLLEVLERRAGPGDVRRAVQTVRDAGFDNISLDLLYGVPDQSASDLDRDIDEALALAPEHVSYYELEAKSGTRFTRAHEAELERQAEALEGLFEQVVQRLRHGGYRWYETANFCLASDQAGGRDFRAQHNLGYWTGRDYLGLGVGAVSTVDGLRWRNAPSLGQYVDRLGRGLAPSRSVEELDPTTRDLERVMLGLRLDEPLALEGLESAVDQDALERLCAAGLVDVAEAATGSRRVALTQRGRFLGSGVTAELLA